MTDFGPWTIFILFGLAIVAMIFGAIHAAKKARERTAALAAMCQRRGWIFRPDRTAPDRRIHGGFSFANTGHSHSVFNSFDASMSVWGRNVPFHGGDYRYKVTTGSGKNRRTTTYTVSYVVIEMPVQTPSLSIRPENFFDKIAGAVGFEDIDFESAEFSKAFHVGGSDRKFVYDVIDPRMIEFLLDTRQELPPVVLQPGRLYFVGNVWAPEKMERVVDLATQFLERWPTHVRDRLGAA